MDRLLGLNLLKNIKIKLWRIFLLQVVSSCSDLGSANTHLFAQPLKVAFLSRASPFFNPSCRSSLVRNLSDPNSRTYNLARIRTHILVAALKPSFNHLTALNPKPISVLDSGIDDFRESQAKQRVLYWEAGRKVEILKQVLPVVLAPVHRNHCEAYRIQVKLKRPVFSDFVESILTKMNRRGLREVGDLSDIVRARIDLDRASDLSTVIWLMSRHLETAGLVICEIEGPRRPVYANSGELLGFGYHRYHFLVEFLDFPLKAEIQIGTKALSEVFEARYVELKNTELRDLLESRGICFDLHDLEYLLVQGLWKSARKHNSPQYVKYLSQKYSLESLSKQLDFLAAEAGCLGGRVSDLEIKIRNISNVIGTTLDQLASEIGAQRLLDLAME